MMSESVPAVSSYYPYLPQISDLHSGYKIFLRINYMQTFPGLLDAHVHGQGGVDFADVGDHPEALTKMMAAIGKTGVSYVMATLVSLQLPTLTKALRAINDCVAQNQQPTVCMEMCSREAREIIPKKIAERLLADTVFYTITVVNFAV